MRMDWIREEGIEEGIEKGIEKGREEGIEIGREEGIEMGAIKGTYETALELTDEETAIRKTCEKYNLTKERLREILTLVEI